MNRKEFITYYQEICQPMVTLMKMAPKDNLDWKPLPNTWNLGQVLQHCAGTPQMFVIAIKNTWPSQEELQKMFTNSLSNPQMSGEEAAAAFESNKAKVIEELSKVSDSDFLNKQMDTIFVKGSLSKVLQHFATDHQNNHKHQLFTYLKLLGAPVNTMTLYRG